MYRRSLAAVAGASLVSLALLAPPASADDCFYFDRTVGSRYSHSYDHWDRGSDWRVEGFGPGTLIHNRAVAASNTFSVSVDAAGPFAPVPVTAGDVSATVGFSVTNTVQFTAGIEFDMPDAGRWTVEAGTRDDVFVFDVQTFDTCVGRPTGKPRPGGTAERVGHLIYRSYPSGSPPRT